MDMIIIITNLQIFGKHYNHLNEHRKQKEQRTRTDHTVMNNRFYIHGGRHNPFPISIKKRLSTLGIDH